MFSSDTFAFLRELKANNSKEWFNQHKDDYEQLVRTPALQLIGDMQPLLAELSPRMVAAPKKVGGSLMRVHRDTRFGKDKTPYKTNIGIQFRHFMGKDVHAPGFYLHIADDECFFGAGIWRPDGPSLSKIRSFIDENPRGWQKAITGDDFRQCYTLRGDALVRPPKGFKADHPLIEDLKRKDFIAISPCDPADVVKADFVKHCFEQFKRADEYMYYLCTALELPYKE